MFDCGCGTATMLAGRACRRGALIVLAVMASNVHAREYAPRVVSPQRADAYSMKTFRQFPRWRDLEDDALAFEVYQYLADTQSGLFHCNEVLEGDDVLAEYRNVRDPVKIINVYGYAYCGILGPTMAGIWEDMTGNKARTVTLPDWSHVVAEAFYAGKWHYMDLDVRAVFRRPDGRLASLDDARRDPSLWRDRGPLFFPHDSLDATRKIYQRTNVENYHGFNQSGHTMDYVLRQGETFTLWWTPQGGRWNHRLEWNREDWLRRLVEDPPRGPKPNQRDFSIHNHGNGKFVYRPDLTDKSSDFVDGAYDSHNVQPTAIGLCLTGAGEGQAIFEVRSPYVIVPKVGSLDTLSEDCEASRVELDADGASLALSVDGGLTWRELPAAAGAATDDAVTGGAVTDGALTAGAAPLDLTAHVAGRYAYLLKISLRGRPGQAVVRRLAITTWVQVAPAALPVFAKGRNAMEYRTGDHYGLKTRVSEIRSEAGDPGETLKYLASRPADYDPAQDGPGPRAGRGEGFAAAEYEDRLVHGRRRLCDAPARGGPQHAQRHYLRGRSARQLSRNLPRRRAGRYLALALQCTPRDPARRTGRVAVRRLPGRSGLEQFPHLCPLPGRGPRLGSWRNDHARLARFRRTQAPKRHASSARSVRNHDRGRSGLRIDRDRRFQRSRAVRNREQARKV